MVNSFQAKLPILRPKIIDGFTPEARDLFQREFDFFDKVTSISGVLFPLPKEEHRAGIKRELEKIIVESEDLYLPTAPNKLVRGIQLDSGIPLQSAAKVLIMITFNVVDKYGDPNDVMPQACIFKVGDDCRQDVLAVQVISLLRDTFEAVGINLYLFPYGVLPTGPGRAEKGKALLNPLEFRRPGFPCNEQDFGSTYGHFFRPSVEKPKSRFVEAENGEITLSAKAKVAVNVKYALRKMGEIVGYCIHNVPDLKKSLNKLRRFLPARWTEPRYQALFGPGLGNQSRKIKAAERNLADRETRSDVIAARKIVAAADLRGIFLPSESIETIDPSKIVGRPC
ncbi:Phosphatidylinositol 4-kinase alpha [Platanthera zijinensis]|uniref:Phosphatidylinositol 4-kinase alpha n=1 Tax=Platanthera zijinensis TaxID=2320716 RepID=A0AAP0G5Z2_9ASPA